jgi:hypothetical protein
MNAKVKTLVSVLGTWSACVAASLVAAWGVSEAFGFRFNPSSVVVISSTLVGVGCWLHRPCGGSVYD